jgi:hypothetical protein
LLTIAVTSVSAAGMRAGVFRLTLTGNQEVAGACAPPTVCGDPDAVAQMILIVIPARDTVCFLTKWTDIDGTVVAAHIHLAPAGVAGGVVVPLFAGAFASTDRLRGCVSANGLADDILATPSAYYVNIHSSPSFIPGAVRAQLG